MRTFLGVVLGLVMMGGWAMGQDDPPRPKERPAPADVAPVQGEDGDGVVKPVEPPDSEAGRALAWVLGVVNGADPGDIASHFTPRYLETYPVEKIREVLSTLRESSFQGAPRVELLRVDEEDVNNLALSGLLHGEGTKRYSIAFLSLDDKTKKIAGLVFSPAGFRPVGQGAEGPDQVETDVGGSVLFGAYEIVKAEETGAEVPPGGEAAPNPSRRKLRALYEFGRADDGAVAGLAKVWVLDAVGSGLAAGDLTWDQPVKVREAFKCIPGGATSGLEEGAEVPLGEMVERMTAKADTTALEHLFRLVGREKVEGVLTRDTPLTHRARLPVLSPREMFALKLTERDALVTDFLTDPPEKQRARLAAEGDIAGLTIDWARLEEWTEPRLIDEVGYFALPETIAATLAHLHELSAMPGCEKVLQGMAQAERVELDANRWPEAYGAWGYEPGVGAAALMLRRDDDRWFAVVAIWNIKDKAIEPERLENLVRGGVKVCDSVGRPQPAAEDVGAVH